MVCVTTARFASRREQDRDRAKPRASALRAGAMPPVDAQRARAMPASAWRSLAAQAGAPFLICLSLARHLR